LVQENFVSSQRRRRAPQNRTANEEDELEHQEPPNPVAPALMICVHHRTQRNAKPKSEKGA
jgi:Na+-transporting methylmalonyl-CoA/oxaloacetate decarboxylase gamma subunit